MWESKKQCINNLTIITVDVPRADCYHKRLNHDAYTGYEMLDEFEALIREIIFSINSQHAMVRSFYNPMECWEELNIEYKDTIIAYRIPFKGFGEAFTMDLVRDIVRDWDERINYKPKPKPKFGRLRPLKCTECGGTVDLQTLICNFCGMQFYMEGVFDGD